MGVVWRVSNESFNSTVAQMLEERGRCEVPGLVH